MKTLYPEERITLIRHTANMSVGLTAFELEMVLRHIIALCDGYSFALTEQELVRVRESRKNL